MSAKKILVADDSLTIQKVIRLALSNEGYEIEATSEGNDAIQHILVSRPDVVLIDITLPGKNAFEVKQEINSNEDVQDVRFVLMSSAFEKVDEELATRAKFHGRLTKPFDPAHLRKVLSDVLAQFIAKRPSIAARQTSQPPLPAQSQQPKGVPQKIPAQPPLPPIPEVTDPSFPGLPPLPSLTENVAEDDLSNSFHGLPDHNFSEFQEIREQLEGHAEPTLTAYTAPRIPQAAPPTAPPEETREETSEFHFEFQVPDHPLSDEPEALPPPPPETSYELTQDIPAPRLAPSALSTPPGPPVPMYSAPGAPGIAAAPPTGLPSSKSTGEEQDIRDLTESTMRISGLSDFEWSVNEPTLKPEPQMMDRGGSHFETEDSADPFLPPPPLPTSESDLEAPSRFPSHFPPTSSSPPPLVPSFGSESSFGQPPTQQISTEQIEKLVHTQVEAILQKLIQKNIPDIAERLIKQEIHRLLSSE